MPKEIDINSVTCPIVYFCPICGEGVIDTEMPNHRHQPLEEDDGGWWLSGPKPRPACNCDSITQFTPCLKRALMKCGACGVVWEWNRILDRWENLTEEG